MNKYKEAIAEAVLIIFVVTISFIMTGLMLGL
jgi:hypothetical protein